MADTKLTALSAIGTLDAADLLYAVDDVAGTPASKKVTVRTAGEVFASLTAPRRFNVLCPFENLIVRYINATTVDIDADAVVLFDTNGYARRFASLNETLAITSSGANGLDTGSEASSTWYHIWAIGKTDGTLDGLLSASATAPTLPAGYDYKGYLGAIRNDGSSNFVSIIQIGTNVYQTQFRVLNAGAATTYTAVDCSVAVPPTASSINFQVNLSTSTGTNYVTVNIAPAGSGTTATYGFMGLQIPIGSSTAAYQLPSGMIPMSTKQEVVYFVDDANARAQLWCLGWSY